MGVGVADREPVRRNSATVKFKDLTTSEEDRKPVCIYT
jgi:hypothetical protein